jgi:hypothetical protein
MRLSNLKGILELLIIVEAKNAATGPEKQDGNGATAVNPRIATQARFRSACLILTRRLSGPVMIFRQLSSAQLPGNARSRRSNGT